MTLPRRVRRGATRSIGGRRGVGCGVEQPEERPHGAPRHVPRLQGDVRDGRLGLLGGRIGAQGDHGDVATRSYPAHAQGMQRALQDLGARDDDPEPAPVAERQRAIDGVLHRLAIGLQRRDQRLLQPMVVSSRLRRTEEAVDEVELALHHLPGIVQEGHPTMTSRRELVDGEACRRREVDIDAPQPGRVLRHPDEDHRDPQRRRDRHALVAGQDVHEHDRVAQRAAREPAQTGRALVGGDEQDLVVVGSGGAGDGLDERQQAGGVAPRSERDDQPDDARALAGQGASACVGFVGQLLDRGLDALPRPFRDGPLAAHHVGDGALRHPGDTGDVLAGESGHGTSSDARVRIDTHRRYESISARVGLRGRREQEARKGLALNRDLRGARRQAASDVGEVRAGHRSASASSGPRTGRVRGSPRPAPGACRGIARR